MEHVEPLKLPAMPPRIAKLPRNGRGYPVPFFVAWINGAPDFRVVRPETVRSCDEFKLCWICGEKLGAHACFAVGPMCTVNRTSAEPPSHKDCAEFAVQACPFMLVPQKVRREDDFTRAQNGAPGHMIKRNPGVMALWFVKKWTKFSDGAGGQLYNIGEPEAVTWWREGRAATRAEVQESVESGLPLLLNMCQTDSDRAALREATATAEKYLPAS